MRIVTLLPSATEIVCALGMRQHLVGVSHECDWPIGVETLPHLSRPKIRLDVSSREIHESVQSIAEHSLSVYDVDEEKLRSLEPDIIITQAHCEVCAVSENEVVDIIAEWDGKPPKVVSISPSRLSEVWESIADVGEALGCKQKAIEVIQRSKERLGKISAMSGQEEKVPVVCLEWADPPMNSGSWSPEVTDIAGGRDVLGARGEKARIVEMSEILEFQPRALILTLCGFGIDRSEEDVGKLSQLPEWESLQAVSEGRIYVCNGNHYFNRPGPRLVESAEILAEILNPSIFDFGHEGTGWRRAILS